LIPLKDNVPTGRLSSVAIGLIATLARSLAW
jgi:hypothetical protein